MIHHCVLLNEFYLLIRDDCYLDLRSSCFGCEYRVSNAIFDSMNPIGNIFILIDLGLIQIFYEVHTKRLKFLYNNDNFEIQVPSMY